jgi:hypothetical protein
MSARYANELTVQGAFTASSLITIAPWFVVNVATYVPSCDARVGGVPTDRAAVPPVGEYAQLMVPPTVLGVVAARLCALAHALRPIIVRASASAGRKNEWPGW